VPTVRIQGEQVHDGLGLSIQDLDLVLALTVEIYCKRTDHWPVQQCSSCYELCLLAVQLVRSIWVHLKLDLHAMTSAP